jgi:predicted DNA-binding protein
VPGVSSTTSVLPLRVPNELLERLDTLVTRMHTTRTDVGRDALQRGLEQLEAALARRAAPAGRRKRSAAAETPSAAKPARRATSKRQEKGSKRQAPSPKSATAETPPEPAFDLVTFAARVIEAAQRTKTGRFGDDRVFINHVWRQYKREYRSKGMDLQAFKQRLVEANRERYLSIVCADMAPVLDQKDVKESEIRYRSATFHFLCI